MGGEPLPSAPSAPPFHPRVPSASPCVSHSPLLPRHLGPLVPPPPFPIRCSSPRCSASRCLLRPSRPPRVPRPLLPPRHPVPSRSPPPPAPSGPRSPPTASGGAPGPSSASWRRCSDPTASQQPLGAAIALTPPESASGSEGRGLRQPIRARGGAGGGIPCDDTARPSGDGRAGDTR